MTAANLVGRKRIVREALDHLKYLTALIALVFVEGHVGLLISS
jgi:hypothetical protein